MYTQPSRSTTRTETLVGKRLPSHIEAEKAVLGALLLNDESILKVTEIITPQDFYTPAHGKIFQALIDITSRKERADLVTLQNELEKKNILDEVGGLIYLLSLQEDIPSIGLVAQHANIIKEKSILRDLISSATEIVSSCYTQDDENINALLDAAEKTIFKIANKRSDQNFVQLNIWLKKPSNIFLILKVQVVG